MPPKPILSKETNLLIEFLQNPDNRKRLLNKFIFDNNHYVDTEYYEPDENNFSVNYNSCDKELSFFVNFKHTENEIILLEFCQPNFSERYGERVYYIKDIINMQHKFTWKIEPEELENYLKNYL